MFVSWRRGIVIIWGRSQALPDPTGGGARQGVGVGPAPNPAPNPPSPLQKQPLTTGCRVFNLDDIWTPSCRGHTSSRRDTHRTRGLISSRIHSTRLAPPLSAKKSHCSSHQQANNEQQHQRLYTIYTIYYSMLSHCAHMTNAPSRCDSDGTTADSHAAPRDATHTHLHPGKMRRSAAHDGSTIK